MADAPQYLTRQTPAEEFPETFMVMFVHPGLMQAFTSWLDSQNARLSRGPEDIDGETPWYIVQPVLTRG